LKFCHIILSQPKFFEIADAAEQTKAAEDLPTIEMKGGPDAAGPSISTGASVAGRGRSMTFSARKSQKRLSLRRRFEKQLKRIEVELAAAVRTEGEGQPDGSAVGDQTAHPGERPSLSKSLSLAAGRTSTRLAGGGGRNPTAVAVGGVSRLSIQLQRLSSTKLKRRAPRRDGGGAGASRDSIEMTYKAGAADDLV